MRGNEKKHRLMMCLFVGGVLGVLALTTQNVIAAPAMGGGNGIGMGAGAPSADGGGRVPGELPPGLAKRDDLPPGLANKPTLPDGLTGQTPTDPGPAPAPSP